MDRKKLIVYIILISIPVLFILFLLALVNIVFLFLGVVVILGALLILKQKKPELFEALKPQKKTPTVLPISSSSSSSEPGAHEVQQVYLVLSGRDSHDSSRILINKLTYSIGRAPDNDYMINDARIGRHHLRIEYSVGESTAYAIDLGSMNGNYLNSERMIKGQRYRLIDGDQLMIDDRPYVVDYAHY